MDFMKELIDLMKLYDFPKELPEKCNAQFISRKLDIKRNTASKHLNILFNEHEVIKINSRPVLFLPRSIVEEKIGYTIVGNEYNSIKDLVNEKQVNLKESCFSEVIGYNDSLSDIIDQTISAISYPGGLPIMLFGNSGVGKSFLAEKLSEYARLSGIIAEDAPFLELNCAQYYHNPELLTSQLFGYTKGAFTGANQDQKGIIENANGGIVFLDEVHRLSPEGQEKLFLHMDKGVFHRIGDTGPWRKSKVFYIFATTEDRNNDFLNTFLRRIPITCKVPDYSERTYSERRAIIFHLFQEESKIVNKNTIVSEAVFNFLLKLKPNGNIGEIKGIVKQIVARKYSKHPEKTSIEIEIMDVPKGYLSEHDIIQTNFLKKRKFYIFAEGKFIQREIEDTNFSKARIVFFKKTEVSYREFREEKIFQSDFREYVTNHITDFSDQFVYDQEIEEMVHFFLPELQNIFQNVAPSIFFDVKGTTIHKIIAYLVKKELAGDFEDGEDEELDYKLNEFLISVLPKEAPILFSIFENTLDVTLGRKDKLFILLCLFADVGNVHKKVNAIILAHGYSTASSIANVTNRMIGNYIFDSIDMPFSISSKEIISKLLNYMNSVRPSEGLIILVDMGSLSDIKKDIEKYITVPTLIMNNVTTALALEVGINVTQNVNIERQNDESMNKIEVSSQLILPDNHMKKKILVSCSTGRGTAVKIKEMLDDLIPEELGIEVVSYENAAIMKMETSKTVLEMNDIISIIGTDIIDIGTIPFISLEELFDGECGRLYDVFKENFGVEVARDIDKRIVKNLSLNRLIDNLTILDPVKVLEQLDSCFTIIEFNLHRNFSTSQKISLYVHLSCMIERLVRNQPIKSFPNVQEFVEKNKEYIRVIKKAMSNIEQLYNIKVPIEEVGYIYNIIELM